jgi:hypothetical protein
MLARFNDCFGDKVNVLAKELLQGRTDAAPAIAATANARFVRTIPLHLNNQDALLITSVS